MNRRIVLLILIVLTICINILTIVNIMFRKNNNPQETLAYFVKNSITDNIKSPDNEWPDASLYDYSYTKCYNSLEELVSEDDRETMQIMLFDSNQNKLVFNTSISLKCQLYFNFKESRVNTNN